MGPGRPTRRLSTRPSRRCWLATDPRRRTRATPAITNTRSTSQPNGVIWRPSDAQRHARERGPCARDANFGPDPGTATEWAVHAEVAWRVACATEKGPGVRKSMHRAGHESLGKRTAFLFVDRDEPSGGVLDVLGLATHLRRQADAFKQECGRAGRGLGQVGIARALRGRVTEPTGHRPERGRW